MTAEQLSVLGHEAPAIDAALSDTRRRYLDDDAWFDHIPSWLSGHGSVFSQLRETTSWSQQKRFMYERRVDVPRLFATIPDDGPGHRVIPEIAAALTRRYGLQIASVGLALYRDGRDSVAWHRDREHREIDDTIVATVSVGAPRPFLLRPLGGGPSTALSLGWGDLLVMGGACQRRFEHCVPKVKAADPRITIMFRPRAGPAVPSAPGVA